MGRLDLRLRMVILATVSSLSSGLAFAQGGMTSSVQVFLPSGAPPPAVVRLNLVRDDGYMDTVFTDAKGKFELQNPTTASVNYTVTVETDRLTYDTTSASLIIYRNQPVYLTIFLKPLPAEKRSAEVLDLKDLPTAPNAAQVTELIAGLKASAKK